MKQPTLGKNHRGFKDLTHTNMTYRCDYCDQGYNQIYHLNQLAIEYFICHKCIGYYKITREDIRNLKYVEDRIEWRKTGVSSFFPTPIGFDT